MLEIAPALHKSALLTYLFTVLATAIWLGGIIWAPYLASHESPLRNLVYLAYSSVCHQIPARSFLAFGQPLAVCARCLGIYVGFLLGLGFYPVARGFRRLAVPTARAFALVSLPIVADTGGNIVRLWSTPNSLRFATGVLWGVILPFYFVTGVAELILRRRLKSRPKVPRIA